MSAPNKGWTVSIDSKRNVTSSRGEGLSTEHLTEQYKRCGPTVYRRALSLLRNTHDALDVMQDTFLAYMQSRPTLREQASAWLNQIATYKAVDRLRRRSRMAFLPFDVHEDGNHQLQLEMATAHEGEQGRVEALRDLSVLTHTKSPRVLTAAVLYFVEGYTMEEVAQALKLSRKKISQMLREFTHRA
jgi:RNA polymerase sigma-70 factor (ECF subfamily)